MALPFEENVHASCVLLRDRGVLIAGDSGSGKTTLALALVSHCAAMGLFARLVADDRTLLRRNSGSLIGRAPLSISGLAEAHGLGPRPVPTASEAVIDLAVELVPEKEALRYGEDQTRLVAGCRLPLLTLAARNSGGAVLAVAARLQLPPFAFAALNKGAAAAKWPTRE